MLARSATTTARFLHRQTARPLTARSTPTTTATTTRLFHATPPTMVKAGDPLPNVDLAEGSPGNKVNLSQFTGKGVILGVPAAFSPSCSETHVPGYMASEKAKSAGTIYVVSVNDAFVMKAWGKALDADGSSGIRFLADAGGDFTKALDLGFDASALLGNVRSKRYALVVDGGKIVSAHVEPDNTSVNVSAAEKVLG